MNSNAFLFRVSNRKIPELICKKYERACASGVCLNERKNGGVRFSKRCNCITNAVSNQSIEVHMKRDNQHLT